MPYSTHFALRPNGIGAPKGATVTIVESTAKNLHLVMPPLRAS